MHCLLDCISTNITNCKRILKVEGRARRGAYCFLRLLLEMHEEDGANGEEGCADESELRCAGHDLLFSPNKLLSS